jgi:peptide/nickel transport system substrate-binding protein
MTRQEEDGTHMRVSNLALGPLAVALALAVAACGGSNSSGGGGSAAGGAGDTAKVGGITTVGNPQFADVVPSSNQQRGGTLNIVSHEAWQHLDPGESYFQIDYAAVLAVHRPLYEFTPDSKLTPDLAASMPKISKDGKTVTVHIRPGLKWSPPLNRTITSADVEYAFERDFNPNVPNPYAKSYYKIVGANKANGGPIPGISTPNKTTIVFHLTSAFGATFLQALTLPGSAPVPKSVAGPMDKHSPSLYDTNVTQQAFSGPYMVTDYKANRLLTLERNPNWKASTDYRPAYADKIVWKGGGDSNVLSRQTLASTDLLLADTPPAAELATAYKKNRKQLSIATLGDYYTSLNTTRPPFDNVNLRRAAVAAADRKAYLLARGGTLVGSVATHFLGPEVAGFSESGGAKGFGVDFVSHPSGDMKVACKYMKAAGYPNCKYTGSAKVLIVGDNQDPDTKEEQIVEAGLQKLGFKTQIKAVPQQVMYSKFCGYTKSPVNVCPTAGWIEDFPDPYSYLYVPFSGKAIVPVNNSNYSQENNPKINAAMEKAAAVTNEAARSKAWARINRMLVMDAPAIPEIWSSNALLKGTRVKGVLDQWNDEWNLTFSSVR